MTDEELEKEIQEVSENINKLSDSDKPLTKEEQRRKQTLLLREETLKAIESAKKRGDLSREITMGIDYALLTSWGESHPFLTHLMRVRLRSNIIH